MAVKDRLDKLNDDLLDAYEQIGLMGGDVPLHKNSENLTTAIGSIPVEKWWEHTDSLTENDIGTTRKLYVNGILHTVRLIGIDHDDLASGTGKAHTTWEFVNVICDNTGHSIATVWNWQNGDDSTNYDYTNSNIRKALEGEGSGTIAWYQKESSTKSTTYTTSVWDMLPSEIKNYIKEVSKVVATSTGDWKTYINTTFTTKLFVPSCREMTATELPYQTNEGTTYEYYVQHDDYASRQKAQIANTDTSTKYPTVTDGNYAAYNYAGYCNDNYDGNSWYWLRSPRTYYTNVAWRVYVSGALYNDHVYYAEDLVYYAVGPVAPCFCI